MNKPLNERIIVLTDKDLHYGFDDEHPNYYVRASDNDYGTHIKVDNFPCYSHNIDLVKSVAERVEKAFPVDVKPFWYVMSHEDLSRTNGYASKFYSRRDDTRIITPYIVLKGKRIPLHPAMTRYLVSHEYGHVVDYFISKRKFDNDDSEQFRKYYAELRGIEYSSAYGARKWHLNTGEVIANDFRIAVAGIEPEFWPHPCSHPNEDKRVGEIWYQLMLEFAV